MNCQLLTRQTDLCSKLAFTSQTPCLHGTQLMHRRHANAKQVAGRRFKTGRTVIYCQRATVTDLEDIDPLTGEIVTAVKSKTPKYAHAPGQVSVGLEWAYRGSPGTLHTDDQQKQAVLLLHGLGSASFSYRETCELLGKAGYEAIAADWPGHGASSKPDRSSFDYSQKSYIQALDTFVKELDLPEPFHVIVQGFVLGQYAMLWAMSNPDKIDKLVVLNTPLGQKTKLRPELAAYKAKMAFMRPDPSKKPFDGANFNAAGGAYAMQGNIAAGYDLPYQEPGPASVAIAETMKQVDFPSLLAEVDAACKGWRKPTLLLFGQNDPFITMKSVFAFLDDQRTNFAMAPASTRMGHMPQEDYPEAIQETITEFLSKK